MGRRRKGDELMKFGDESKLLGLGELWNTGAPPPESVNVGDGLMRRLPTRRDRQSGMGRRMTTDIRQA